MAAKPAATFFVVSRHHLHASIAPSSSPAIRRAPPFAGVATVAGRWRVSCWR
jgi:hypothetical protein